MIHKEYFFSSSGTDLYCQHWLPDTDAKANIVLIHGGGDHSGRFQNIIDFFIPSGYGLYIFDLRGHGKSPGKRGHINSWDDYRQDLSAFIEKVHLQYPDHQLYLFGHSMGGTIVLDYCIRNQRHIAGVIVTSPAIGKLGISPMLFRLAKILDKLWPSLVLPTGLVVPHLSRDTEFIKKTLSDPLYHSRSTPRFGMEFVKTIQFIHDNANHFRLPLCLIHGTDDRIASIEGSRKFVNALDPQIVSYKEYADGYHELFNDFNKEKVLTDLTKWLKEQAV